MNRYSLDHRSTYTFTSVKGRFWVTIPGDHKDYIVECGQHIEINDAQGTLLISEIEGDSGSFVFEKTSEEKAPQFSKLWRAFMVIFS